MTTERVNCLEAPYVPFPENARKMKFLGHDVYEYISPGDMRKYVERLSERINLRDYDGVMVNLQGGMKLFDIMRRVQGYIKWPYLCEYHRRGVETTPVDSHLRNRKILIVDDSLESGLTMREMFSRVGPESRAAVAMIGYEPGRWIDPRIDAAVLVDRVKIAGMGADHQKKQLFRQWGGVFAIPPIPPR